ncbi:hypothetical protein AX774_g4066 [Zancudomyces culisetae]|uniref:Uncharacterized protein n=1 Tax=Zancudomyces culisetae TaxID=1213189 RepID=A0A1R1PCH5_ZANCU|nr:hypothetical protein AX774_g7973 [Zancudomyces culisetae]OMH82451.1 hypothetical protein AX774_g4066 [Zancudomyces culisetae]|eukprot:OMH78641.1 hypothetical protein AX774_g7973 [Zancudomyces culisetae]
MALKKELKEVQSMLDGMKELDDELEDDELERKCLIKTLELEVKVCIDDLAATMEEIELIKHFEKIKVNTGDEQANKEEKVDSTWRLDGGLHGKKLLDGKGKPLKTFTLTNDRKTITKNVFRPGYSLPTKTIDEFLEDEFKRGGVITSSKILIHKCVIPHSNGPEIDPDEDDNDEELKDNDAELYKQRNWDDFKDDTPRGSGNRTNHG